MGNSGQPAPAMASAPSLGALPDLGLCPRSPVSPLWWLDAGLGRAVRQRLQSLILTLPGPPSLHQGTGLTQGVTAQNSAACAAVGGGAG